MSITQVELWRLTCFPNPRHDKNATRLKKTLEEAEIESKKEKEELRKNLTKLHKEEMTRLQTEIETLKDHLEHETNDLLDQLERLKETHDEEAVLAENDKQQALMLGAQEQTSLK